MSDGEGSDQPASPLRRQQARAQGHVARSPELAFAILFAAAAGTCAWKAPSVLAWMAGGVREGIRSAGRSPADSWDLVRISTETLTDGLTELAPLLLALLLAAVAGHWIQHGPLWVPQRLTDGLSHLNLVHGWQRLGAGASPWRMVGAMIKIGGMGAVAFLWWRSHAESIAALGLAEFRPMCVQAGRMALHLIACYAVILLGWGAIDFGVRYWQHELALRMMGDDDREEVQQVQNEGRRSRRTTASPGSTDNQSEMHSSTTDS